MIEDQTTELLALVRDLAAGLGFPVAPEPDAAGFYAALGAMEAASPGAAARLRSTLGAQLEKRGAAVLAAGGAH